MAQRYILALDYADLHAQKVLKNQAKKRPLGTIQRKHHYTPAQPVLSCRTVDIDVSGTRTYRPKSTTDIIQEQHRLIHNIYTKTRNVSSAPNKRVWSSSGPSPEDKSKRGQTIIEVQGRPLTSKSQSVLHCNKVRRSKSSTKKRPKTTGALKNVRAATESCITLKADSELLQRSRSYRELTNKIHDHWEQDTHDLRQGKFVRGEKKPPGSPALDAWLTFGAGQSEDSNSVVDAFAQADNEDYYNIEGGVGSRVAEQLHKGDRIRIGINGSIQSHNLRIRKGSRATKSAPCLADRMGSLTADKVPRAKELPLCWDDQVLKSSAKIISPSLPPREMDKLNLCERHPVIFRRPGESDETPSQQPRIAYPSEEGYKVKKQGKKFSFNDSRGLEGKITDIIFEHAQLDNGNKLQDMSVDDVIKNALNRNNIEKNINEEANGIQRGNDDKMSSNDQENLEESFSTSQKENFNSACKTGMSETGCSSSSELARVLKVKPTPPTYSSRSRPMDLSICPIDNSNPLRASSEGMDSESPKLMSYYKPFSERPSPRISPKPFLEKNRQLHKPNASLGVLGIKPETEYLQISSQIINPHGSRKSKPEMYATHAMTNEAIRQVRKQNKLGEENIDGIDTHRSLSPSSTSRAYTAATPSLAISIPTADDDSDRESAFSPYRNGQDNETSNMTSQQIRELNIRDAQIDEIAYMLGEAIIGQNDRDEDRKVTSQKHKKTVRIKED